MVYLDYSATTPVNGEVLDSFVKCNNEYIGNPNSLHKLGIKSKEIIDASTKQIKELLGLDNVDIIYTSGSSEANNLAIKGICSKYANRGKHIITTPLEHSSIYGPINYLIDQGFEVSFVKLDKNGRVDIENLKELIRDDTILVSINAVNSEIGILQSIEEIGEILSLYPKIYFHADLTQAIGKVKIDTSNIDLFSFTAHKFYGLKGIGCLVKKDKIVIEPLIHGGRSTTIYRSGTPTPALIVSLARSLRLALNDLDKKYEQVLEYNNYLKEALKKYNKVRINSNETCIPHILNISILGVKPETMLHALEEDEIYISTQSACSANTTASKAVMSVTNDDDRAKSSIRVSLSSLTTKEELDKFLSTFDKCYQRLTNLK
ncbi:MAG: cysteine desulfurase [Bacilli bacterium]|nr:cysteine desulfurase [Bacilli bacterium]